MKDFDGGTALITGGASGIGFGMAQALSRAGLKIALADINPDALATARASLRKEGAPVEAYTLDVSDPAAWKTTVDAVEKDLGPLQILCSNAGVAGSVRRIEETEWEGWAWTIDVNLHGTFHALKTCIPRLKAHGRRAHIVCTSSLGGFLSHANNAAYSATKAGVIAICESLRGELAGTAVGVSVLCPGLVRTELNRNNARLGPKVPLGGHGPEIEAAMAAAMDPAEVGEFVVAGIRENRFWLFTHPELRGPVEERCREILDSMTGSPSRP